MTRKTKTSRRKRKGSGASQGSCDGGFRSGTRTRPRIQSKTRQDKTRQGKARQGAGEPGQAGNRANVSGWMGLVWLGLVSMVWPGVVGVPACRVRRGSQINGNRPQARMEKRDTPGSAREGPPRPPSPSPQPGRGRKRGLLLVRSGMDQMENGWRERRVEAVSWWACHSL